MGLLNWWIRWVDRHDILDQPIRIWAVSLGIKMQDKGQRDLHIVLLVYRAYDLNTSINWQIALGNRGNLSLNNVIESNGYDFSSESITCINLCEFCLWFCFPILIISLSYPHHILMFHPFQALNKLGERYGVYGKRLTLEKLMPKTHRVLSRRPTWWSAISEMAIFGGCPRRLRKVWYVSWKVQTWSNMTLSLIFPDVPEFCRRFLPSKFDAAPCLFKFFLDNNLIALYMRDGFSREEVVWWRGIKTLWQLL